MASLTSCISAYSPVQTEFWCEKGFIKLNPRWHEPSDITVWKEGGEKTILPSGHEVGYGYQYEAVHVMECLDKGIIESPKMTWEMSLDLMEILDRIRIDAGIFFPEHDKNMIK